MLSASISARGYSGDAQRLSRVKGEHLVDLPTYTSIWRIEKRLYKLYDFRLPMPLPIGQVTVFVAIAVPYVVLLTMLGLPFNHTLIWLYILPPGLVTWLVTRPVLESKRLPELIKSQLRYLAEPRVLCRMAPLSERDVVVVTGRVWRPRAGRLAAALAAAAPEADRLAESLAESPAGAPAEEAGELPADAPAAARSPAWARGPAADVPARPGRRRLGPGRARATGGPAPAVRAPAAASRAAAVPAPAAPSRAAAVSSPAGQVASGPGASAAEPPPWPGAEEAPGPAGTGTPAPPAPAPPVAPRTPPQRPTVTVVTAGPGTAAPPSVERALAGPSARRGDVRAARVTVVPGGDRPGQPDLLQRDRARAQLPVGRPARIVLLGCTVGAGQTTTALLVAEVLASLRSGEVAVLDLNPGPVSLAMRAEFRPALGQAAMLVPSRLVVVPPHRGAGEHAAGRPDPAADAAAFDAAADRYEVVLADPATAAVPRLLAVADQLVLVAPASAAAPNAVAMTFEWLEAHGRGGLAAGAVMALNGVSRRSMAAVEQAERVCSGRCRAIVRVPWDDQLQNQAAKRTRPAAPGS